MFGVGPVEIVIVLAAAILMAVIPAGRRWLPWILPCLIVAALLSPGGDPISMMIVAVPLVCLVVGYVSHRRRTTQSH
jgi:Sec-independent protein secretion pathway component TatC